MFPQEHERTITELRAAEAMRDRLFRVATHDLKNPIANLRMVEYILRDTMGNDPDNGQLVDTIQLSLDAMEQVIDDFMDVVVIQSGKIKLNLKPVPIGHIICNQWMQYSASAAHKQIAIKLADMNGTVLADPARLNQVVSNLLSNALKYSPTGSMVSLWIDDMGDRVRLNIADQGSGIPEEERSMLFTEFGKLTPRPTAQENSTGLGLWIVKQLMEMMNGTVGVESPPDGGSTFWIELPAC